MNNDGAHLHSESFFVLTDGETHLLKLSKRRLIFLLMKSDLLVVPLSALKGLHLTGSIYVLHFSRRESTWKTKLKATTRSPSSALSHPFLVGRVPRV